jgi:hypothetical protein
MRWPVFDYAAGAYAGRLTESVHPLVNKMLQKVRMTSIAAATLLASPAFAGWPFVQPAQIEQTEDQRIINEIVVNGRVIEADSDEAPANELRPSWVDESGALDRRRQRSW